MVRFLDNFIEKGVIGLLFFTPLAFSSVEPWSELVMEIGSLSIFVAWLFKMLIEKRAKIINTPINFVIVLFLLVVVVQLVPMPRVLVSLISPATTEILDFYTVDVNQSGVFERISLYPWATQVEMVKLLSYAMVFFVVANNFVSIKKLKRLVMVIMIVGSAESFYGIISYLSGDEMIFRFSKMYHTSGRLIGTFPNPDHFGAYLKMCIFLSMGYLMGMFAEPKWGRGSHRSRHRASSSESKVSEISKSFRSFLNLRRGSEKKILIIFCITIMIIALIFTKSRGGVLSFIISFLFFAAVSYKRTSFKKNWWIIIVILLTSLAFGSFLGLSPVLDRYFDFSFEKDLEEGRLSIWSSTYEIFKNFPLLGTGFGSFFYVFPSYSLRTNQGLVNHAHNDWLELLSDTGIIGFVIMAGGFFLLTFSNMDMLTGKGDHSAVNWLFLGGYTSILSIAMHCFTDFNLRIPAVALLLSVIIGIIMIASKIKPSAV